MSDLAHPKLSVVIPLWNEEKNIEALVSMLAGSKLLGLGLEKVVLINNGSADSTGALIEIQKKKYEWLETLHLPQNLNYGGGIWEGLQQCKSDYMGFIPGDLQVHESDLVAVWNQILELNKNKPLARLVAKGNRTIRKDGANTKIVSYVYTFLANTILGTRVQDINGLPKIFHRDILSHMPSQRMKTFVFDAQILYTARQCEWPIVEVPVTFHARREGVSSWSKKRFETYWNSFKQLRQLKRIPLPGAK